MIEDFIVALIAIFIFSMIIYLSGVIFSRRSVKNEPNKRIPYACGERATTSSTSKFSISLYKYIIFFITLDSPLVIIAFASTALNSFNIWFFITYVFILFISSILLLEVMD